LVAAMLAARLPERHGHAAVHPPARPDTTA
jgi:hypothetical protein